MASQPLKRRQRENARLDRGKGSQTQISGSWTLYTSARVILRLAQELLDPNQNPQKSPGPSLPVWIPTSKPVTHKLLRQNKISGTAPPGQAWTSAGQTPAGCWWTAQLLASSVELRARTTVYTAKSGTRQENVIRMLTTWMSTVQR